MSEVARSAKLDESIAASKASDRSSREPVDITPQPARKRIARNLVFLTSAEACVRLLTLITSVVVARVLGPSKLGEVALALTLAVFFSGMADGGLTLLTYRRIVAQPDRLSTLVVDTTFVQIGLGLLMLGILVLIALAAPFSSGHRELLIVFSPYVLAQALNVVYALQALERMGWVAVTNAMTQVATSIPTIVLVLLTHQPVWVGVGLVVGQLAGDLIMFGILRQRYGLRLVLPDLSAVRPLLRGGLPLLGSLLLFNYLAALEVPTLSIFRSPHQVGIYSAAARIVYSAGIISQVLFTAVLPELVRRFRDDKSRFADLVVGLVALTVRLTFAATLIVMLEPHAIVNLLYGRRYGESAVVLAILAPVVVLMWYGHLLGYVQVAAGRQRDFFTCFALASVAATIAYPVGAAIGGRIGMSIAVSGIYGVEAAAFTAYVRRRLGVSALRPAIRQLPYAVVPAALVLTLRGVTTHGHLAIVLVLWLAGIVLVEAVTRWPSVRFVAGILRGPREET